MEANYVADNLQTEAVLGGCRGSYSLYRQILTRFAFLREFTEEIQFQTKRMEAVASKIGGRSARTTKASSEFRLLERRQGRPYWTVKEYTGVFSCQPLMLLLSFNICMLRKNKKRQKKNSWKGEVERKIPASAFFPERTYQSISQGIFCWSFSFIRRTVILLASTAASRPAMRWQWARQMLVRLTSKVCGRSNTQATALLLQMNIHKSSIYLV